jgi:uncharacterized protein (TIGR02145 family)
MKNSMLIHPLITGFILGLTLSCSKNDEEIIPAINFNPSITYGNMKDQEGNTYKTVTIGSQVWMAENLRTMVYRNGDPITNISDDIQWKNLTSGAYCCYDNSTKNSKIYGCLYNWYALNDNRNIAPVGWHVPSDSDWKTLTDYLGGVNESSVKLKETGINHWRSETGATNESGFTALPGGYRGQITFGGADLGYNYAWQGTFCFWWTSTDTLSTYAFERGLNDILNRVENGYAPKDHGNSIRCVKN